jgi:hypothetical protein
LSNSNAIIGQVGHTDSAAQLCLNLITGGQKDWYLPSIDELSLVWQNSFNLNKTLSTIGGATVLLTRNKYWSSTESDNNTAWIGGAGSFGNSSKNNALYVRAVRDFTL